MNHLKFFFKCLWVVPILLLTLVSAMAGLYLTFASFFFLEGFRGWYVNLALFCGGSILMAAAVAFGRWFVLKIDPL